MGLYFFVETNRVGAYSSRLFLHAGSTYITVQMWTSSARAHFEKRCAMSSACPWVYHFLIWELMFFIFSPAWWDRLEVAFVGFSLYSNLARIFSTKTKKDHLECMNGIRFLSFCWLIVGHTYLFGPVYADCWIGSEYTSLRHCFCSDQRTGKGI